MDNMLSSLSNTFACMHASPCAHANCPRRKRFSGDSACHLGNVTPLPHPTPPRSPEPRPSETSCACRAREILSECPPKT
eukprot:350388-Chlamydomonas_euryale.AAC.18